MESALMMRPPAGAQSRRHTASSTVAPRFATLVVVSSALASRLPLPSRDTQQ